MRILGVREEVEKEIIEIAKRNHLKKVIFFGSRARGDFKRTSDIDLAVSGGDISLFCVEIEEETPTLLEFDVVDLDKPVQQELRKSIENEGIVLYEEI